MTANVVSGIINRDETTTNIGGKNSEDVLTSATTNSTEIEERGCSYYIRVADFINSEALKSPSDNNNKRSGGTDDDSCSSSNSANSGTTIDSNNSCPHFTYASVDPPPGITRDPSELWVALNNNNNSLRCHAPIGPLTVQSLAKTGLHIALDKSMWTVKKTGGPLQKIPPWQDTTWESLSLDGNDESTNAVKSSAIPGFRQKGEDQVLLWVGKYTHSHYGSEIPLGRSCGIIHMSPRELCDLLIDSSRVREYNKLSLGREDLLFLQDCNRNDDALLFGPRAIVTKIMCSKSSPPVLRRTMEFVTILHACELPNSVGYLLVTRSVANPQSNPGDQKTSMADLCISESSSNDSQQNGKKQQQQQKKSGGLVQRGEILLGVNIIRKIEGEDNRCLLINIFHLRAGTNIPMPIANRMVPASAVGFIKDLRQVCKNNNKKK